MRRSADPRCLSGRLWSGVLRRSRSELRSRQSIRFVRSTRLPKWNKLRHQKQTRIEVLQKRMVESMVVIAQNLEGVPANERIALAVTIPYYPWEKSTGMPRQILIQAAEVRPA